MTRDELLGWLRAGFGPARREPSGPKLLWGRPKAADSSSSSALQAAFRETTLGDARQAAPLAGQPAGLARAHCHLDRPAGRSSWAATNPSRYNGSIWHPRGRDVNGSGRPLFRSDCCQASWASEDISQDGDNNLARPAGNWGGVLCLSACVRLARLGRPGRTSGRGQGFVKCGRPDWARRFYRATTHLGRVNLDYRRNWWQWSWCCLGRAHGGRALVATDNWI